MEKKREDFLKKTRALEAMRVKMEKRLLSTVASYYDMVLMSIPPEVLNKPLRELSEDDLSYLRIDESEKENTEASEEVKDGGPQLLGPPPKFPKRSARSCKIDKYKTPARTIKTPMSAMVTPKFNPHSAMALMRRPKEGEVAMSMSGSPLHVSSVIKESKPAVVLPFEDGTILSVLPENIRKSEVPELDPEMRRQLKALNDNISVILSMNRSNE